MHILCIALRYNKPNKLENHKSILFIMKTSASVLFLEFRYFELRNIYKRIPNRIRIQYSVVSLFIDSGAGLVLSIWFVLVVVLNTKSNFIIAKLTVWLWCGVYSYNEQTLVNKSLTW